MMKKLLSYLSLLICLFFQKDVLCRSHGRAGDTKIVGGYAVDIKNVPHQVRLTIITDRGAYGCGGSILNENFILTAAHCLPNGSRKVHVRAGSNYTTKGGVTFETTKFWVHPKYNSKTIDNDAGIVKLESRIQYNNNIRPIGLPDRGMNIPRGTEVTVSGWGATSENGRGSDVLLAIKVPTWTNEECLRSYTYISENMLCAGVAEGGKSVCQGDSGGAAYSNNKQLGIASFGIGCARPRFPGVYARVSSPSIRDWIKSVTGL